MLDLPEARASLQSWYRFKSCRAHQFNTMNNYTDTQLKQALAKMLPEQLELKPIGKHNVLFWRFNFNEGIDNREVLDTELLHLCWLVEQTLTEKEDVWFLQKLSQERYKQGEGGTIGTLIDRSVHATWQQRVISLAKVKGVEIV